jgi:hypothetical protein
MPGLLIRCVTVWVLLVFSGCAWLTPRTAELEDIHRIYREEFMTTAIPADIGEGGDVACRIDPDGFARTLQAIHDFRVRHPDADPAVLRHLHVLQAMIFLQSGRPGMARLISRDFIPEAGSAAGRRGAVTRDALFADNLDALIDGWTVYCELSEAGGPFPDPAFSDEQQAIQGAARAIRTYLQAFETTDPVADEGAVYLAASAALFQMWATKIQSDRCRFGKDCAAVGLSDEALARRCAAGDRQCEKRERQAAIRAARARDFAAYRELIGRFLSEPEKRLADSENWQAASTGRYRYLAVYRYLGRPAED